MICVHCSTPVPDGSHFCSQCGADPSDPGSHPRPTARLTGADLLIRVQAILVDRYDVTKLLGQGGMGAVYLAQERTLDRPVAVKVLPPEMSRNQSFVGRFEREARTAAKLDHPNIIPIYAVESKDGLHYFVMKYVTGRSLDDVLQQGPLPIDVTQRILWECAGALGHAHRRGIIHRDIKPGNIMIEESGRAMVTDFGISKALEATEQLTATGQVIGTPHYMSPEQSRGGDVDGRSDLYSLGVVAYRMITGRLPFGEASVHTIIYKQIFEEPQPVEELNPRVPPFIAAATRKAMAKDPAERFATMEEFASAVWPENRMNSDSLSGVSGSFSGQSSVQVKTEVTRPSEALRLAKAAQAEASRTQVEPARKKTALLGGAIGIVIAAAAVVGVILMRSNATPSVNPAPSHADTGHTVAAPAATGTAAATGATAAPPHSAAVTPATKTVEPPRPAPRPAPVPAATSFLTINASPFGTVFVDGVEVGDTPIVSHVLTAGRHIVEVRREGYRTAADTVQIVAGNTTRLNKTLIKEP